MISRTNTLTIAYSDFIFVYIACKADSQVLEVLFHFGWLSLYRYHAGLVLTKIIKKKVKDKVLQALKTKYKNLGFGEKVFDGVADKIRSESHY